MNYIGFFWKMKSHNPGAAVVDPSSRRLCYCSSLNAPAFSFLVFILGTFLIVLDYKERVSTGLLSQLTEITQGTSSSDLGKAHPSSPSESKVEPPQSNSSKDSCVPSGSEMLPKGIICRTSDLEMVPLRGPPESKENTISRKSLLAMPVGINQKEIVNQIVMKFDSDDFAVMLFHYDGIVDQWRDLKWSGKAIHVSAINQTKWWFAKRFLHPDVVAPYKYIFLWDEDIGVDNFDPKRYLKIVEREGLEISQPALDPKRSQIHHPITARSSKGDVHRRMYKFNGSGRCYANSTDPPCTGWVEMMAPVFSGSAWRCSWHIIQNDLIHAWGLDKKLGYCARGDRSRSVGVVDSEYIVHLGLTTLGQFDQKTASSSDSHAVDRYAVRRRSYVESKIFRGRWKMAVEQDKCWRDPYHNPQPDPER